MNFTSSKPPDIPIVTENVILQSADEHQLTVSRRFLAYESLYFRSLFTGDYGDSWNTIHNLPFEGELIFEVISAIQKVTENEEIPLWSLSDSCNMLNPVTYLQMERLLPYLHRSITNQVDASNLINVYRYALLRDFNLAQQLWQLLLKYFNKLTEADEYQKLTEEELVAAMTDEKLNIDSKLEVPVLNEYLAHHQSSHEVYQLTQKMKTMDDGFIYPVVMNRVPREILVTVGGWSNVGPANIIEIFNPRNERWTPVAEFQDDRRAYHSMSQQDNKLIICGGMNGREYFRAIRYFDMDKKEWGSLPDMSIRRCYVNSVSIPFTDGSSQLMVIGGYNGVQRQSSCELVSPVVNGWRQVKNMTKARSDGAAILLGDGVLAIGGFDGRQVHQDGELYDVVTDSWYPLARKMQFPRTGTAAAALNRCVVLVAGGFNGTTRLASAEFYDTREGKWHALPYMQTTRSNFAMEMMNGYVYAIGGFDGVATTAASERFDMAAQRWISMPDLSLARSALKVIRLQDHDIIRQMTGFDPIEMPTQKE